MVLLYLQIMQIGLLLGIKKDTLAYVSFCLGNSSYRFTIRISALSASAIVCNVSKPKLYFPCSTLAICGRRIPVLSATSCWVSPISLRIAAISLPIRLRSISLLIIAYFVEWICPANFTIGIVFIIHPNLVSVRTIRVLSCGVYSYFHSCYLVFQNCCFHCLIFGFSIRYNRSNFQSTKSLHMLLPSRLPTDNVFLQLRDFCTQQIQFSYFSILFEHCIYGILFRFFL